MTRQFEERCATIPSGAVVTGLSRWSRDPNVICLEVAGATIARLHDAECDRLAVAVSDPWTDELAGRVRFALARQAARRAALVALGRRAMTRAEVLDRLHRREHDPAAAESVVDDLHQDGWIDDEACAEAICRTALTKGPAAPALLEGKLARHGIDPETAGAAVRRALEGTDLLEAAESMAKDRLRRWPKLPRAAALRRVAAALARRGFDEDTIATVVDRLSPPGPV